MFVPFDYFEDSSFVTGFCGFPRGLNVKSFAYMKASGMPPFIWYSNRPEDDYPSFALGQASLLSVTPEKSMAITAGHELAHELVLDPLLRVILTRDPHSPLSEVMAQLIGEPIEFVLDKIALKLKTDGYQKNADFDFFEAMFGNKPVDYVQSLLCFLPFFQLVDLFSYSDPTKVGKLDFFRGLGTVYNRLKEYFYGVVEGSKPRLSSHEELAKIILPIVQPSGINLIMREHYPRFWSQFIEMRNI